LTIIAVAILGEPTDPAAAAGILLTVAAVAYGTVLGVPRVRLRPPPD
jgi:hypothetical protein